MKGEREDKLVAASSRKLSQLGPSGRAQGSQYSTQTEHITPRGSIRQKKERPQHVCSSLAHVDPVLGEFARNFRLNVSVLLAHARETEP